MADRQEDLSLPLATVSRVIQDSIPANINVSQEARKVIAKTASVFVLYTTATAAALASKAGRKTMNANDVLEALVENEFAQFKDPLERSLACYRDAQKKKKETNTARKSEQQQQAVSSSSKSGKSPSPKKSSPKQLQNVETVVVSDSDDEGDDDN